MNKSKKMFLVATKNQVIGSITMHTYTIKIYNITIFACKKAQKFKDFVRRKF